MHGGCCSATRCSEQRPPRGGCPMRAGVAGGELRELGQGESEDTAVLVWAPCLFSPSLQAFHGGSMWWCLRWGLHPWRCSKPKQGLEVISKIPSSLGETL